MALVLQWLSFGLSMLCVFCYGHSKVQGASVGIMTAIAFIVWGVVTQQHAAWLTNIVFFFLHSRNLRRALREKKI